MGLRCVNDFLLYCTNQDRLAQARSKGTLYDSLHNASPCRLQPANCGHSQTLSQQIAALPPPPEKPAIKKTRKSTKTEVKT